MKLNKTVYFVFVSRESPRWFHSNSHHLVKCKVEEKANQLYLFWLCAFVQSDGKRDRITYISASIVGKHCCDDPKNVIHENTEKILFHALSELTATLKNTYRTPSTLKRPAAFYLYILVVWRYYGLTWRKSNKLELDNNDHNC